MLARAQKLAGADSEKLRALMTRHVGVLRDAAGLRAALAEIAALREKAVAADDLDLRNRSEAALLIAASALRRRESRGGHFRTDYPQQNPALAHRSVITLEEALQEARKNILEPSESA